MEPNTIKKLAEAIHAWLTYQELCGRGTLLSESSLSQPIGDFLTHFYKGRVKSEVKHPNLSTGTPGRPRQLDYALFGLTPDYLAAVLEAKWVRNYKIEPQSVVDDLLRLEIVRARHGQMVDRYFIVAGRAKDFEENFKNAQVRIDGHETPYLTSLLSFDPNNGDTTIAVRNTVGSARKFYRAFESAYVKTLPVSFRTKLVGIANHNHFSVHIWRVSSVPRRATFSPGQKWQDN